MVAGFHRSASIPLPAHPPNSPAARPSKLHIPRKSPYHVRSTSLPCRRSSHSVVVVAHVEDEVRALAAWHSHPDSPGSTTGLSAGLARIDLLLAAVDDLLRLPHSFNSLQSSTAWTERLLDDFLRLADAHGTFRSAVVALKQHQSEAQVATRRRDEVMLASCQRSQRRAEKELVKLASDLRHTAISPPSTLMFSSEANLSAELAGTLTDAVTAMVSASASVFIGVASAASEVLSSSPSCPSSPRAAWMVGALRRLPSSPRRRMLKDEGDHDGAWRVRTLEGLAKMEECLASLESGSERVFRRLVNTRVSILNILTPSF